MSAIRLPLGPIVLAVGILAFPIAGAWCSAAAVSEVTDSDQMHLDEAGAGAAAMDAHAGHAASPAAANPVSVDPDLAIVTAIVFLVLLAVLWKFAWGPIAEAIDQREKSVADNLAEAHRNTEEARRLLAEHESKLASTAAEVKQLLDQGRREAESQKQQLIGEAQLAAQSEKQRALREIEAAKTSALQELARSSVETAVDLAGKIVQRQLTPDDHARLINEALQKFPSDN